MTLQNAVIPYVTIRDAILDLLRANKSILNNGMTSLFSTENNLQIIAGNIFITPTPNNLYPVIFIKIINKKENWDNIGNAGRKRPVISFRIYGITRKVTSNVDSEIMNLAKNIESIFRNNITINNNVLMSHPTMTDFGVGEVGKGTYVDIVAIDLECMVELK